MCLQKGNDMQNTFKTQLYKTLNTLIAQREVWEDGVYKQANAEMYAILEKCAEIYAALKEEKKNARAFNAIAEEQGINFNKGTSLALKIVRFVFGAQRNREFAYASVIKIWYDEREEAQTLTNYVIEQGGIENVRRTAGKQVTAMLGADEYRDIAEGAFENSTALTTFSLADYMLGDENNDTDYMVALVRYDKNGVGSVLAGSNKRALVSNTLAALGKQIDDLQQAQKGTDTQAVKREQAAENMKHFLAGLQQNKAA
jgi:hypothetical protein